MTDVGINTIAHIPIPLLATLESHNDFHQAPESIQLCIYQIISQITICLVLLVIYVFFYLLVCVNKALKKVFQRLKRETDFFSLCFNALLPMKYLT